MKHDFRTCPSCQSNMQELREWAEANEDAVAWMCEEFDMEPNEARLYLKMLEVEHVIIGTMEWMIRSQLPQMFFAKSSIMTGDLN